MKDADCFDDDPCTEDKCLNPGTANARCVHRPILVCAHNDGCCPPGCSYLNDNDCKPECGNDVCEPPYENKCTCPEDCGECEGKCKDEPCWEWQCVNDECQCELQENCCGNYVCEEGENFDNCPEDCCQIDYPYPPEAECDCPPGTEKHIIDEVGSFICG